MRITLLRHGKAAFELKGNIQAKNLGEIAKSYDLSGIVDVPPRETAATLQRSNLVICSHLEGRNLRSLIHLHSFAAYSCVFCHPLD